MKSCSLFSVVIAVALATSVSSADDRSKISNPFTVAVNVPDPDGEDVKEFADKVKLWLDKDANAGQWVPTATAGKKDSLDGEWSFRWNGAWKGANWVTTGTATVKKVGDRVYIFGKDRHLTFLIDAKLHGKSQLAGRQMPLQEVRELTPWVGTIVDNERIDGVWEHGRWDFRRKIAEK